MIEIQENILTKVIAKRKSDSHKGNYGRVLLIGGNENYGGAIIMATEGTINSGTGLTAVATHSINLTALHSRDPEAMYIDWRDSKGLTNLIQKVDVIVCGPGLGLNDFARNILNLLKDSVTEKQTVVLDASALDLISENHGLIPHNAKHIILTPHQMEWQRVSQIRIPFQDDKANKAALAQLFPRKNVSLVLKSNQTHIYNQDQVYINTAGNPGMATGGMGDTLSGIIAGFVAQFGTNVDSILAAVFLHSMAGDLLYEKNYVVKPTQISKMLPSLMKKYAN
ncbi:NAD(P)H-hydrate dehydratase [Lactobacillus agrestimuris]|uniref:NAD(P)H-hydrate dehydratase n=1 Tax=Lactobacillus agrestimuris TaxID=2941328 RepID=UPI002043EEA2|nr:NAD(P)H-hydrate dehydratase [Lactobacillus agrestimuris]